MDNHNLPLNKFFLKIYLCKKIQKFHSEYLDQLYQDIIHFTVGLSYEVANACHDIAERMYLKGKKSYES